METKTAIKGLVALGLFSSLSIGVVAQPDDLMNISTEDVSYAIPIKHFPPPPPPPPPYDDLEDEKKLEIELTSFDHIPHPFGAPIPIYGEIGNPYDQEDDPVPPDHDPGVGPIPVETSADDIVLKKTDIRVYPNPTTDYISVDLNSMASVTVKLLDTSGRLVLQQQLDGNEVHNIDLRKYRNGVYYLLVENEHVSDTQTVLVSR